MSSSNNPEYRLRNFKRELTNLLMGRRLAVDSERTGVVDLVDFGKRCDKLAALAAKSVEDMAGHACAQRISEELELAARLAAQMETLPKSAKRVDRQCRVLEEVAQMIEAALKAECALDEPEVFGSLSGLAQSERRRFEPFIEFAGTIAEAHAGLVDRGLARRTLRRALLDHEQGPFRLTVSRSGTLRFGEFEFETAAEGPDLPRTAVEPAAVRQILDMREGTNDDSLRDFLLVKAVDEALAAVIAPRLQTTELSELARALPQRPGKRLAIRPEAVARPVHGWDAGDALRGAEKLAARRLGPEWARLPRGAYILRLFLSEDDALAADLLALGPALRRMQKGEEVADTAPKAMRALRGLLGLLG